MGGALLCSLKVACQHAHGLVVDPTAVRVTSAGNLWMTDRNCLRRLARGTLEVTTVGPQHAVHLQGPRSPFKLPQCVVLDAENRVYVADTYVVPTPLPRTSSVLIRVFVSAQEHTVLAAHTRGNPRPGKRAHFCSSVGQVW